SRRRHTRSDRDWSSDVCSSDLLVLIGGDPGIGKSTLALQLAGALGSAEHGVLYVSGEESPRQARMRAERIALRGAADHLWLHSRSEERRVGKEGRCSGLGSDRW